MLVADAPPHTAPKKIPTPEPKFAVVAISHVKGEFKYGSGMIELCLYDFNGPSFAFFGVPHFSVIPPSGMRWVEPEGGRYCLGQERFCSCVSSAAP